MSGSPDADERILSIVMNKNWQILSLLISLLLLAAGIFFRNESIYSDRLAVRGKHSNPARLYIHREIKTDLYKHPDGPEPLTGWETSGIGNRGNKRRLHTKISEPSGRRTQQAFADTTNAGHGSKDLDSLASANRDSASST